MQIKKIHPPAHVVVVSDEYDVFNQLKNKLNNASDFKGYYSHKAKNGGKIDYKLKGKIKHIENKKVNSYSNKSLSFFNFYNITKGTSLCGITSIFT